MSNLQRARMFLFLMTALFIITISVSCGGGGGGGDGDGGGSDSTPSPAPTVVAQRTLVPYQGGRVAWHHGLNLIAFDHPNVSNPAQNEVSVINPDGSGRRCLTCNLPGLPLGLRGQPAWHPSGEYLVIQAPNLANIAQSGVTATSVYHGPGWGINNDLWLIAADGSWAERITLTPLNGAALHPQFSENGDRLFWAVRIATGVDEGLPTPGGENPWQGWHLEIASFSRAGSGASGVTTLGTPQILFLGQDSFFESHHLSGNRIWFSRTQDGWPYVDEGLTANADGSNVMNLTNLAPSWDEHVAPSPGGRLLAFNSSRGFPFDGRAGNTFRDLQTELWAFSSENSTPIAGAAPIRLTNLNADAPAGQQAVTSDYDWGPNGREIVVYYVYKDSSGQISRQSIDIITLNDDF